MKHTAAMAVLSAELLRFLRDRNPTEAEFLPWLGGPESAGIYHVLRKAGLVTVQGGRVGLHPEYLSPDGRYVFIGNRRFHIDGDQVDYLVFGKSRPASPTS